MISLQALLGTGARGIEHTMVLPTNSDVSMPGNHAMTAHSVYTPYPCVQTDGEWHVYEVESERATEDNRLTFHFTKIRRSRDGQSFRATMTVMSGRTVCQRVLVDAPAGSEHSSPIRLRG